MTRIWRFSKLCSPRSRRKYCFFNPWEWKFGRRKKLIHALYLLMFFVLVNILLQINERSEMQHEQLRVDTRRHYLQSINTTLCARHEPSQIWNKVAQNTKWRAPTVPGMNESFNEIKCPALFADDAHERKKAEQVMKTHRRESITDCDYINLSSDCDAFRIRRGYFQEPLSEAEEHFPLAFSILMYKDVEQVERLLRAIYMPQNYYCIHIDLKAPDSVHTAMQAIVRCFPNVFIASKLEEVYWGHISIMHAEMNCIRDLLKFDWTYFINLSGQMFPLQTNLNLVKILQLLGGANDIEGSYIRTRTLSMVIRQWVSWRLSKSLETMFISAYPKGSPPYGITIYKGSNQVAVSRQFAKYTVESKIAKDIIDWFSDTLAPDEYIWPSLNHNSHLGAPGGYTGDTETKPFLSRASIWLPEANQKSWSWDNWHCQGIWIRDICIFSLGELPWLSERPELFANKFHLSYQWLTYDCMEELHFNRTLQERKNVLNTTYYKILPYVQNPSMVIKP